MITKDKVKAIQAEVLSHLKVSLEVGDKNRIIGKKYTPGLVEKAPDYSEHSFYKAMARAVALGYSGMATGFTEVDFDFIKELKDRGFTYTCKRRLDSTQLG